MRDFGYTHISAESTYHAIICSYCGEHLGEYRRENGREYDSTDGWQYCPFCGTKLLT